MILFKRLTPLLTGILLLALFEGVLLAPRGAWVLFLLAAFVLVAAWLLLTAGHMHGFDRWLSMVLPLLLVVSTALLTVLTQDALFLQTIILVSAFLHGWYLENLFLFHFQPHRYQPYALENISGYASLLVVFFFFAALFAARVFLNLPLYLLLPVGFVVTAILALQIFWSTKVPWSRGWPLLAIATLVLFELLGVLSMLPTSYFVSGLLMAIPYYLMMNLARHWLRDRLTVTVIRRYMIIGGSAFVVTLLTAPWS